MSVAAIDAPWTGDLPRGMVIGDARVTALSGATMPVVDPATGKTFTEVPRAGAEDVDRAVVIAKAALSGPWRDMHPADRGRVLMRVAELLRRERERLARIETLNCGKPISEARADIEVSARYFEYFSGLADKLQGDTVPGARNYLSYTLCEPVGVTAHIVPWNFPLGTATRGVAPALAAANTVVLKPADQTPISALVLADLLKEAGLPAGVYNVVTGLGPEAGAPLAAHPDVAHVTFTGSVATGKAVMRGAADHIASVTLELGGKSPVIVLADANVEDAIAGTMKAIYKNAGQVCSAGSRLVVDRSLHDRMVERLVADSAALEMGHGLDDPHLGPLISRVQLDKVIGYVDGARRRGIAIAAGGERAAVPGYEDGHFYAPTILDDVDADDVVAQEEIFGPVLAVQIVDSAEEALAVADNSDYGLVAAVYTSNVGRALQVARDLDVGGVYINDYYAGGIETPFGGVKNSGFGRERGMVAIDTYIRVKSVSARISP